MYTLRFWRSYLGSVGVDLLNQEPAGTVGDPFKAYIYRKGHPGIEDVRCTPKVPGEVTWVSLHSTFCTRNPLESWGTHLQPMFLESHPGIEGARCTPQVPGKVT